jgi:hypothetical protein
MLQASGALLPWPLKGAMQVLPSESTGRLLEKPERIQNVGWLLSQTLWWMY